MDANKFMSIKDRARRLIQMDNAGEIDRIAESKRRDGSLIADSNGDVSYENTNTQQQNTSMMYEEAPITFNTPSSKRLPKEIVESFRNNTIDTNSLAPEASILDQMGIIPKQTQKPVRTKINEVRSNPTSTPSVNATPNSGIDYSLIKMIVEESVKKYMSAYTKKILSESTQKTSANPINLIQMGDKINFVTKNGDLYEAKLVFKKNLKNNQD